MDTVAMEADLATGKELDEEMRRGLETLQDKVAVLEQKSSRANWAALGLFIPHTTEEAVMIAEEHLGFD